MTGERKPPQLVHPLRRESDHTPTMPPTPVARKRKRCDVIDLVSEVRQNVRHFQVEKTRRELYESWLRDVDEYQLMSNFRDGNGGPKRREVEKALVCVAKQEHRELILLRIENGQLKQDNRRLKVALEFAQARRAA